MMINFLNRTVNICDFKHITILHVPCFPINAKNRAFYSTSREKKIKINFTKIYSNADLLKLEIINENRDKSGIYMWKNNNNKKFYIGSSVDLKRRFNSYFNLNYLVKESRLHLHRALLKHGFSAFSLYVIEYCEKENLIDREQYYFDLLKPNYNICTIAGSTLGRSHDEKTKENISKSKKGTYSEEDNHFHGKTHTLEARNKMAKAKLFKNLSEETKEKISTKMKGRKLTEEHKTNLSLSKKNNKKLCVLDIRTNEETIFDSISNAEKSLDLPKDSIRANLRSKSEAPYRGIFKFKVLD